MTVPGDQGRPSDDDPLVGRYRELGGLGTHAAGAPDLGDLLRRDRQHERRRVSATAVAVVSTMGAAAWVGSAVLGVGRTPAPQTAPAAQVAGPTAPRSGPGTSGWTTAPPTSTATPTSTPRSSSGGGVSPVIGEAATDTPTGTPNGASPTAGSGATSPGSGGATVTSTVQVWFETGTVRADGCHPLKAVTRTVTSDDPVTATLHQLLVGPTRAEQQAGLRSDFGPALAAASTVTHGSGAVIVDFATLGRLANVPITCRRAQVANPLNLTLGQFPSVKTRVFTLKGDAVAYRAYLNGPASPTPTPAG